MEQFTLTIILILQSPLAIMISKSTYIVVVYAVRISAFRQSNNRFKLIKCSLRSDIHTKKSDWTSTHYPGSEFASFCPGYCWPWNCRFCLFLLTSSFIENRDFFFPRQALCLSLRYLTGIYLRIIISKYLILFLENHSW